MATIRLIPSTSAVSNSSYASISNASNMYTNTDSTTYGTFTHNRASTSNTYYGYLRGFNFSAVPDNAIVSSFTVKIKASATGHTTSTSSSYYMSLVNNTTQIGSTSASGRLSTTVTVFTFAEGSLTWDTIKEYGSNFGIRIPMRRASSNTADVVSVYGAEIEVEYTVPTPRTITTTLTGNGTITPSGSNTYYDGDEINLIITPANTSDTVTATRDGTDITSQLVAHGTEIDTSRVLGAFTLESGSFNSGESWFEDREGKGHDTSDTTTSNYYSGSSSSTAVFTYDVDFSLPSNANITRVYAIINAHAESSSNSSEYMCFQLVSGSTDLSEEINFKTISTSNTNYTLECDTLPTVAQIAVMKLRCRLGYYGGALNGATVYVEYDTGGTLDHYTYTFTVSADTTINVVIGGSGETDKLYVKINGTWVEVTTAYKKVNGAWVEQSNIASLFNTTDNFKKG